MWNAFHWVFQRLINWSCGFYLSAKTLHISESIEVSTVLVREMQMHHAKNNKMSCFTVIFTVKSKTVNLNIRKWAHNHQLRFGTLDEHWISLSPSVTSFHFYLQASHNFIFIYPRFNVFALHIRRANWFYVYLEIYWLGSRVKQKENNLTNNNK